MLLRAALWLYAVLYITGVPAVALVCYALWALLARKEFGRKGALLFANALLAPVVFIGLYLFITKLFHVDLEAARVIERTMALNDAEVKLGMEPSARNSLLAFVILGGFYMVAIAIPAEAVAIVYGLVSSVLLLRGGERSRAWVPFVAGALASIAVALGAFFLKAAIFSWAKHLLLP